jgi:hypothetical protein
MLVAGPPGFTKQVGRLVCYLQVSGLANGPQLGHDALRCLPDEAALGLGQRPSPARPQAGEVGLLGGQVLGQDDLLPFALEEHGTEREAGAGGCGRPSAPFVGQVHDVRQPPGLPDDPVRQPVDVEHLHLAPHAGVLDQDGELADPLLTPAQTPAAPRWYFSAPRCAPSSRPLPAQAAGPPESPCADPVSRTWPPGVVPSTRLRRSTVVGRS